MTLRAAMPSVESLNPTPHLQSGRQRRNENEMRANAPSTGEGGEQVREPASTPAATHNTATPQHHNTSNVAIPCYDVSAEHRGASGAPPLPPASAMLTGTAASRLRRPPHAFRGCGSARARAHACTRQHAYASIHTPVCIKAHRAPIHTRAYH